MSEDRPPPRWPRWMAWIMTWGVREFLVFTLGGILLVILATVVIYAATGNL